MNAERRPAGGAGHSLTAKIDSEQRTAGPWWAKPVSQIRPEELDRLDRQLRRATGLLETAAWMMSEVAA